MGTIIETDITLPDTGEIVTPVIQALAWYELGVDAATGLRNLANPAAPGALTNAFVGTAGYQTLGGNANDGRVNTGLLQPADFTMFCVSRVTPGQQTAGDTRVVGSFIQSESAGLSLRYNATGTSISIVRGRGTSQSLASPSLSLTGGDTAVWRLFAFRELGTTLRLQDLTKTATLETANADGVASTGNFWLGANPAPASGGTADLALFALYDRALTDAEIGEVAAFIRSEIAITMPGVTV